MELYHIDPPEFCVLDRIRVDEHSIRYELEPVKDDNICPECKSGECVVRHGIRKRRVRDLSEHGLLVGLVIHSQRYHCRSCNVTWESEYESVPRNAKTTARMATYIQEQSLKRPFLDIAQELDMSTQTVRRIFNEYAERKDAERVLLAPKVLGLDENYINGKYRGMYVDVENGLLLDMTPDRNIQTVRKWLRALPQKDRIQCVTMDMWGPYRDAVYLELGEDIPIVVDKFHVVKHVNEALDSIRKKLREGFTSAERQRIRKSRWLLLRNGEELSKDDRDALNTLLQAFPQFAEPYELKERFRRIYMVVNRKDAERMYGEWVLAAGAYTEYAGVIDTIANWRTEIFNYFDHRYTNAVTESLNRLAKEIASRGRGYSFAVLRAKMLYGVKAAKPPKYRYSKEPELRTSFYTSYMSDSWTAGGSSYMSSRSPLPGERAELVSGSGTDIEELIKEIVRFGI